MFIDPFELTHMTETKLVSRWKSAWNEFKKGTVFYALEPFIYKEYVWTQQVLVRYKDTGCSLKTFLSLYRWYMCKESIEKISKYDEKFKETRRSYWWLDANELMKFEIYTWQEVK